MRHRGLRDNSVSSFPDCFNLSFEIKLGISDLYSIKAFVSNQEKILGFSLLLKQGKFPFRNSSSPVLDFRKVTASNLSEMFLFEVIKSM